MPESIDVVVVGGGQAGLAASHELTVRGLEHVVLERGRIGQTWRDRWDTFCLVTPNWSVNLPDHPYAGDDPDGYMPRDEIVATLERYASAVHAPVREGVEVGGVERRDGRFVLETTAEEMSAKVLVLATGAYQRPHRPAAAATLPADLLQIDIAGYTNPDALPQGAVLIVGSGQSGCQLAEELHEAGRRVVLSCGRAPWAPRRIGERDIFWWAVQDGFMDQRLEDLPSPQARLFANILTTGHGGGHDLHLRTLRAMGVVLVGHLLGAADGKAMFADDLLESVAWGDERFRMATSDLPAVAARLGEPIPEIPEPTPFGPGGPTELELDAFGAVIYTSGFRPAYGPLAPWPEAFDPMGFPIQRDGASTVIPGLSFVGVHFLRKRKSSLLLGVGEDAGVVADGIAASLASGAISA